MRLRLRPAYSAAELAALYPKPHCHDRWADHRLRVEATVPVVRMMCRGSIADLSCGDAAIARIASANIRRRLYLGDYAPGYEYHGPIERTILEIPRVDTFVCCETLEHLDDPDAVLARIRNRTRALIVSTPDGETTPENPEHYWGWDRDGVRTMLTAAHFQPVVEMTLTMPTLGVSFQIWGCE